MRAAFGFGLTLLCIAACSTIELPEPSDGMGQGGGGGMNAEGGGDAGECTVTADCPETGTACIIVTCTAGKCVYGPEEAFKPIPSQTFGDCRQTICDGDGNTDSVVVEGDTYDDGNPCTLDECKGDEAVNDVQLGASCPDGRCNQDGFCVECIEQGDCGEDFCQQGVCVPASCLDGVQNGDETALDCGNECAPCADGLGCDDGPDCVSGVCPDDTQLCAEPTCFDVAKNQNETDVDCGGANNCPRCAPTAACLLPSDCDSSVCVTGACEEPSCTDAVANGTETDVDCGSNCPGCGPTQACKVNEDCASLNCVSNACKAATCTDGIKNGQETGIDCGVEACNKVCKTQTGMEIPQQP